MAEAIWIILCRAVAMHDTTPMSSAFWNNIWKKKCNFIEKKNWGKTCMFFLKQYTSPEHNICPIYILVNRSL